jgi:pullulanase
MNADIFTMTEKNFVLWWRGEPNTPPPKLIIGQLQPGASVTLAGEQQFDLQQSADFPDLWMIPAANCKLTGGQFYHYWFEITDTNPQRPSKRIKVTDPMAFTVDERLRAPQPDKPDYNLYSS